MLGKRFGVAAQIKRVEPNAIEIHGYGHSLNLTVNDVTKSKRCARDSC